MFRPETGVMGRNSKHTPSRLETQFGEFKVFIVEVCTDCDWNRFNTTFTLGDGIKRRPI